MIATEKDPYTAIDAGPRGDRRSDIVYVLALSLAWWGLALVVDWRGEFPLNDDWAYAWTARNWLATGEFVRHGWTWTPVYPHVAWGALFGLALGPSHETFRISTLVMGCVLVLLAYAMGRRLGAPPRTATAAAAVVLASPLVVNLSFTFMTDITFAALFAASLTCFAGPLGRRPWTALCGVGLAVAAMLCRQPGAAILLALPIALVATAAGGRRRRLVLSGLAAVVVLVAIFAIYAELAGSPGAHVYTIRYFLESALAGDAVPQRIGRGLLAEAAVVGLCLLPLAVRTGPARDGLVAALVAAAVVVVLHGRGIPVLLGKNVMHGRGVGPETLAGYKDLARAFGWAAWPVSWLALTSAFVVSWRIGRDVVVRWRTEGAPRGRLVLVAACVIYVAGLALRLPLFDRYQLPVVVVACALAITVRPTAVSSSGRVLAVVAWAGIACYAVLGTRDYLDHHRLRRELLQSILAEGVTPAAIDGGFEFDGEWNYGDPTVYRKPEVVGPQVEFVVSYEPALAGYDVWRTVEHRRFLPPFVETIYAHRRAREPERRR